MTIAHPTAATGVSTGAMSSARGRISPIAPSTSTAPSALSRGSGQVLAQAMVLSSFSFGTATFIVPASRNTAASTPAKIHSTMFTVLPRDDLKRELNSTHYDFKVQVNPGLVQLQALSYPEPRGNLGGQCEGRRRAPLARRGGARRLAGAGERADQAARRARRAAAAGFGPQPLRVQRA